MSEPMLRLENATIGYERAIVCSGINLTIPEGSFTALLGANGSGKTTLLKTLAGILPLQSGQFRLGRLNGPAVVLGYVPQKENLDPLFLFSSFEVALMGTFGRQGPGRLVGRAERDFVRECLAATGAGDLESRRFSELSGGQKQRVLIARALASRPDCLLLDEPTAGVDPAAVQALMDLLQQIHREKKITVLMVNHDLSTLQGRVDYVVWMHHGKVEQGPAAEMLRRDKLEAWLEMELR